MPLLLSQMQKQNLLAWTSKDSHSTWEEQLKSRYYLEERAAQNDREKAQLLQQVSPENSPDAYPIPRRTVFTFLPSSYMLGFFCYPCHSGAEYLVIWGSHRKQQRETASLLRTLDAQTTRRYCFYAVCVMDLFYFESTTVKDGQ